MTVLNKASSDNPNRSSQRGVGLIEVLIALVVFALGVVGMAGLQLRTLSLTMDSTQRTYAVSKAQDIADRIRSNGIPASEYLSNASSKQYNAAFCDANAGAASCSDDPAASCNATQMALYDAYDAFCVGEGSLNGGQNGVQQVVEWNVNISCAYPDPAAAGAMKNTTTCDEEGATVTLTTTWLARSAIDDASGNSETDSMTLSFVP